MAPTALSTLSLITHPDAQVHTSKRPWWLHKSKLNEVFKLLQEFNWTLADFLYFIFWDKDEHGRKIKDWSEAHMQMASKFLGGFCKHAPANIVEIWVKSPWGILKKGHWERNAMFSMDHDFRLLKPAWPGITSFAFQIVKDPKKCGTTRKACKDETNQTKGLTETRIPPIKHQMHLVKPQCMICSEKAFFCNKWSKLREDSCSGETVT